MINRGYRWRGKDGRNEGARAGKKDRDIEKNRKGKKEEKEKYK